MDLILHGPYALGLQWWMQTASNPNQTRGKPRGNLEDNYVTLNHTMTNKRITNNELLSFKFLLSFPWLVGYFHDL